MKNKSNIYKIINSNTGLTIISNDNEKDKFDVFLYKLEESLKKITLNFNLKVFYFECSSKLDYKIDFNKNNINTFNINDDFIEEIKKKKSEDFYYFYINKFFDILFIIPKIDEKGFYICDFLIITNTNFDIKKIVEKDYNFLIIKTWKETNTNNIDFDWLKNIINDRSIFNDCSMSNNTHKNDFHNISENCIDLNTYLKNEKIEYSDKEFLNYLNNQNYVFYSNFNQNIFAKNSFKLLDMGIYSFDKKFYKIHNYLGYMYDYKEVFNLNFFKNNTDFTELNKTKVEINNKKIKLKQIDYYNFCINENVCNQNFFTLSLCKKSVKTGFIDLNDF